ncbi:MAG: hypothetical protein NTV40_10110 [Solirubrobacterales bacterium]|nr:hypothetical protein [Solirubrobacterales bacterium]
MINILITTTTNNHDIEYLSAAAAEAHPDAVTVLLNPGIPAQQWGWADTPRERDLRDQMAFLLAHVQRATGAAVAGIVGDEATVAQMKFDTVLRSRMLVAA